MLPQWDAWVNHRSTVVVHYVAPNPKPWALVESVAGRDALSASLRVPTHALWWAQWHQMCDELFSEDVCNEILARARERMGR